jgi:hypothetical protein
MEKVSFTMPRVKSSVIDSSVMIVVQIYSKSHSIISLVEGDYYKKGFLLKFYIIFSVAFWIFVGLFSFIKIS